MLKKLFKYLCPEWLSTSGVHIHARGLHFTFFSVQPVQWTNAWTGDFKRWNNLRATMTTSDGEIKSISGGFVQLSGLHAATEYDLRTAYSTHPDGRDSVIEPSSGERLFTTKAAPGEPEMWSNHHLQSF